MIQLEQRIINELAGCFGIEAGDLQYLAGGREDSDGIVYSYMKNQKKQVLKICAKENGNDVERLKMKLEFARFLGENGVTIACPKSTRDGNVLEVLEDGKYIFIASVMDYIEGSGLKTEELEPNIVKQWGKLTGHLHAVTKKYSTWSNIPGGKFSWGIDAEIDFFYNWCRNKVVKEKWLEVQKEMASWEKNRDYYGFTHNDNHQNNIIVRDNNITLIDFDCAECTFLLQDVFIPVQGILFDEAGGINRPITDMDRIKRFYESFLAGYETQHHIEDRWLTRFETLLNYRRLLLFTVMQDWMEADEAVRNSFLGMIENPCKFSIL